MSIFIYRHIVLWFSLFLMPVAYGQNQLSIPNPELQLLNHAQFINQLPSETKLSLIIHLKLRNKAALDKLVEDIYNPNSLQYHQFLTKTQYEQQFAPTPNTEETIVQYFKAKGMSAKMMNHRIHISATVNQIEKALKIKINRYRFNHQIVYSNHQAPKLPSKIGKHILEISGLSNIPLYQNNLSKSVVHLSPDTLPKANPTNISLQGFTGEQLQKAYNLSNIPAINGQTLDGTGQTLVITDLCGSNTSADILQNANKYFLKNSIKLFRVSGPSKNFSIINPDGSTFNKCLDNNPYSNEINLDVQASHTIAPGNNTVLVLGTSRKTVLIEVIDTLIRNNFMIGGFPNAYVISNSWGGPEVDDPALENALEIAASSGISVNFSSGDCGDNTYTNNKKCTGSGSPTVNYPASSPFVTAVGATTLFVNHQYQYAFETVWGTVKDSQYDGGTGGGISSIYGPVNWQNSIHNFYAGGYGSLNNYPDKRALPDISMLGDPETGLIISSNDTFYKDGGTSLACPLFSASLLLVNQARNLLNKGTPIGQAAPYLYYQNQILQNNQALRVIIPPFKNIKEAVPPYDSQIDNTPAPASAFNIADITFGWDSSLTVEPESQYWNDTVGVGSPNLPKFIINMANM